MIEIKAILAATDFSESADAALERGAALAWAFGATLHVLNIVTQPPHEMWAPYAPAGELFMAIVRDLESRAMRRLDHLPALSTLPRDRIVLATAWGDPSDEILKYARDRGVGLIVCGTHGRRGWDRVLMGSVAERVVRLAPCPVLTVPPIERQRESENDIRRDATTAADRVLAS